MLLDDGSVYEVTKFTLNAGQDGPQRPESTCLVPEIRRVLDGPKGQSGKAEAANNVVGLHFTNNAKEWISAALLLNSEYPELPGDLPTRYDDLQGLADEMGADLTQTRK